MRRRAELGPGIRAVLLAGLVLAAGCAGVQQERDPAVCTDLFEQYNRLERQGQVTRFNAPSDTYILAPRLERQTVLLIQGGCVTRTSDLDGMEALGRRLVPFEIEHGGAAIRPVPVQVGVVTGFTDERRATVFFRGLGYNSRGVGLEGLGRRILIGPFDNEAALEQAISVAREAGFISPFAAVNIKF